MVFRMPEDLKRTAPDLSHQQLEHPAPLPHKRFFPHSDSGRSRDQPRPGLSPQRRGRKRRESLGTSLGINVNKVLILQCCSRKLKNKQICQDPVKIGLLGKCACHNNVE